jgi:hypothetical protein
MITEPLVHYQGLYKFRQTVRSTAYYGQYHTTIGSTESILLLLLLLLVLLLLFPEPSVYISVHVSAGTKITAGQLLHSSHNFCCFPTFYIL